MSFHHLTITLRSVAAVLTTTALTVGLGNTAAAATLTYTGGGVDSEFTTALNWDTGTVPTSADTIVINNGDTVESSVDSTVNRISVTDNSTLNISTGILDNVLSGSSVYNELGRRSPGTINQSGGEHKIGHQLRNGSKPDGNGTYNLSGGSLLISRGSNSNLDLVSGFVSLAIADEGATGAFNISGGSLTTRTGVAIGAAGTFHVQGSGATSIAIGSHQSLDGFWHQATGSVLRVGVDALGSTDIFIDDFEDNGTGTGTQGDVIFADGAILDPYDLGGAVPNAWETVMTWEGTLMNLGGGLVLSTDAVTAGWEHRFDGNNLQVRLVTVPEPASLALLAIGSLAIIRRRMG